MLKMRGNFRLLSLKVVAAACDRWLLTRDSKYSDLTRKIWYFGNLVTLGDRFREMVATRGSTVDIIVYVFHMYMILIMHACLRDKQQQ